MENQIVLTDAQEAEDIEIVGPVNFKLSRPIQYVHPQDGQKSASFILMNEPTYKSYKIAETLKERFVIASSEQTEKSLALKEQIKAHKEEKKQQQSDQGSEENEDEKMKPHEVMAVIESSNKVNAVEVANLFAKLLKSDNLFLLDGQQPMTDMLINEISFSDFNRMLGEYYLNFLVQSLLA